MDLKSRTLDTKIKDTWNFVFSPKQVDKGNNAFYTVTSVCMYNNAQRKSLTVISQEPFGGFR